MTGHPLEMVEAIKMLRDAEMDILNEGGAGNRFERRTTLQRFLEVRNVRTQIEDALERYWELA